MKHCILGALTLLVALSGLAGCGGGGGSTGSSGGDGAIVGRVLNVETGGPISPAATVQAGPNTSATSLADGSFVVSAPNGTTSLLVDTHAAFGVWSFTVPSVSGTVDAGDLWVGPQKVTLTGRVISSVDSQPIEGAIVSFAGRKGTTNSQGIFSLTNVAYSSLTQTAFWGVAGSAVADQFFGTTFSAAPSLADNGVVTVNDVVLTPLSDTDPPEGPFNIIGRVTPSADAPGTIVTLKDAGGNAVRVVNVDSSGDYTFWVSPGDYTITYENGSLSATSQTVTLTSPDEVVRVPDAILN
jgi:hypothetical protein